MTTRKRYMQEFKLVAIRLVTEHGYSGAEAARNLGVNANMLRRWVREYDSDESQAFRGNGKLTPRAGGTAPAASREPVAQAGAGDPKKSDGLLRERVGLRYQFIAQERKSYPVKLLCRLLGVSRGGFDDYLRRRERETDPERQEKLACVRRLADVSDHTYGSRRMAKGLRALGYPVVLPGARPDAGSGCLGPLPPAL